MKANVDYRIDEDTQSLGELWSSLAKLSAGRAHDNNVTQEYPLDIRKRQIEGILLLANTIKKTHEKIDKINELKTD